MTAKSAADAVAKANSIVTGYGGMCLQFVRTAWGVPAKYAAARTAWQKATKRHLGLDRIPVGAPLFMDHKNSRYGHVVIWLGGNKIRSTNSSTGRVATYDLSTWQSWGYYVLGWTEDLNGVNLPIAPTGGGSSGGASGGSGSAIPGITAPIPGSVVGQHTGGRNADGSLQLATTGELNSATIRRWQEVMGTPIDGKISDGSSALIRAVQSFLNRSVDRKQIAVLNGGREQLEADGKFGTKTAAVLQFWLRNKINPVHQKNLIGHPLSFDGKFGRESVLCLQFALNNARAGSKRFGEV